ncbi:hypothetical protein V2J09_005701, partial [Rumex salicifolius]
LDYWNKAVADFEQSFLLGSTSGEPESCCSNTSFYDVSALVVGRQQGKMSKEEYNKMKTQHTCELCKQKSHMMDSCFKLHGYKGKTDGSSQKSKTNAASQQDNPLDFCESSTFGANLGKTEQFDSSLVLAICQEVMKATKGQSFDHNNANFKL